MGSRKFFLMIFLTVALTMALGLLWAVLIPYYPIDYTAPTWTSWASSSSVLIAILVAVIAIIGAIFLEVFLVSRKMGARKDQ